MLRDVVRESSKRRCGGSGGSSRDSGTADRRDARLVGGRPVAIRRSAAERRSCSCTASAIDHRSLLSSVGPVFERARPGYRRLHVDLPGFGASPADPSIESSDAAVEFVLELIDAVIGTERFLLVGESWGAYLARAVVADRRDRSRSASPCDIPMVIAAHAERDVAPAS